MPSDRDVALVRAGLEAAEMTADYVKACLDYNQETGDIFWKCRPASHFSTQRIARIWNTKYSGQKAGSLDKDGYIAIRLDNRHFTASRLIWLMVFGAWPHPYIDHINCDRTDNRLVNLREATKTQNNRNTKIRIDNSSGLKGVSWRDGAWEARIKVNNNRIRLGRFGTAEEAYAAYCNAAHEHHGAYASPRSTRDEA